MGIIISVSYNFGQFSSIVLMFSIILLLVCYKISWQNSAKGTEAYIHVHAY